MKVEELDEEIKKYLKPGWQLLSTTDVREMDLLYEEKEKEIRRLQEMVREQRGEIEAIHLFVANADTEPLTRCHFCVFSEDKKLIVKLCKIHRLLSEACAIKKGQERKHE